MRGSLQLKLHFFLLFINVIAVGWLFAKTQTIDVARHYQQLADISELKQASLSLDRSIFELNVAWLNNYDPIVDGQSRRNRIIDHLRTGSDDLNAKDRAKLLLNESITVFDERDRIADEIKRAHSQAKNAEFYLPLLIKDVITHLDKNGARLGERLALIRLGDLVAIYGSKLSGPARVNVETQLQALDRIFNRHVANDAALKGLLDAIFGHTRIMVNQGGRLAALSRNFLTLDYENLIDRLYTHVSNDFAGQQYKSQNLIPMLYCILLLLIVHIAFLFIQLLFANRRAVAKADHLEIDLQREKEVNGLQRQFVSMVSHEFRTPLAIIDGNAQRLVRGSRVADENRLKSISTSIRKSVGNLVNLMESVLNAARLEEGRIQVDMAEMDLRELVADVAGSYSELHADRAITLAIEDLPTAYLGDFKLLRQVISNLLSNAIKYSESGSPVDIEATVGDGMISVAVRDHGVGIPDDEIKRISERFFRARSSIGIAGTGIGLHLVRYILDQHGGHLDVTSVLGKGSCFSIELPAAGVRSIEACQTNTGCPEPTSKVDRHLVEA